RPMLVVNAGIHYQPDGAQHFAIEVAVARIGILEEAHVFAETLSVERPTFAVGRIEAVLTKRRKLGQSLRDRDLHVVTGHAFVIGRSFNRNRRAMAVIAGVHINDRRPRTIRSSARIAGPSRFLFAILLHWTHFQRSLG